MENYGVEGIKVLEGLEGVRIRPSMYLGDMSNGVFQIFKEILDNSIDEWLTGHNNKVSIKIDTAENSFLVADWGRGIPTEIHPTTKISTLTTVFTKLHAGGKFNNKVYRISAGVHGVGSSCVNATAKSFEVWTRQTTSQKWKYQRFEKGIPVTNVINKEPDIKHTNKGTVVKVIPDESIFKISSKIPYKKILNWIESIYHLCPKLNIEIDIDGKTNSFYSEKGILDMVNNTIQTKGVEKIAKPFVCFNEDIESVLCWTFDDSEHISTYVNCSYTEGGTHLTGLKKIITRILSSYSKEPVNGDDLRVGLYGALHIKISEPQFSSQTKEKLVSSEGEKIVSDKLTTLLEDYFKNNEKLVNQIVQRAKKLSQARDNFKKEKEALKGINIVSKHKRGVLPGKLIEASASDPKDKELYICEGDSACGSLRMARDTKYQEILPLRGKILNALKASQIDLLENEEIKSIITSIGLDIIEPNPRRCRIGKVLIMCDADFDGSHIEALLLSFFIKYMSSLIKEGMVYIVKSPLYIGTYKGKHFYGMSEQEVRKHFGKDADKVLITRMKGHGEANVEDVYNYAMNPRTRNIEKITSKENALQLIEKIMGSDNSMRKEILNIEE